MMRGSAHNASQALSGVTPRALAIACMLTPLLALWVVKVELILDSAYPTTISLFFHVTFTLLVLALLNMPLRRRAPRLALTPAELLTIYMMLSIAGTFYSHDLMQILVPMISHLDYGANPVNRWGETILSQFPAYAVVTDRAAEQGLAIGNAALYARANLAAWLAPLGFWALFILLLAGALLTLNLFFRHHWTERERLGFPVIQIPLTIATRLEELLRDRLFQVAFGITVLIDIINSFNFIYPAIPRIPILHVFEFRPYLVERPWNAIADVFINLCPFAIGLAFFMATDLAFSCWFFYLFFKAQLVLTSALGLYDLPGFPFVREQASGGYLGLALLAIWISRRHLRGVARAVLGLSGAPDQSAEPVTYRTAVLLFLACVAGLVVMGTMLGARPGTMIVFFAIFLLYSLAIARMRAELGPPAHDLHYVGPHTLIQNAVGNQSLPEGDRAVFGLFYWFNRAYRAHLSAHGIEGFKLAQISGIHARSMFKAMLLAAVAGIASAFWAILHLLYVHGYSGRLSGDAYSQDVWNLTSSWLAVPGPRSVAATLATLGAAIFALVMGTLRMNFTWWAWHPVGYAIASSWSMDHLWFCIFLAWLAKVLITRYGGAAAYRRAVPFFVGLVLGEFVTGALWSLYGALANTKVYCFWGL